MRRDRYGPHALVLALTLNANDWLMTWYALGHYSSLYEQNILMAPWLWTWEATLVKLVMFPAYFVGLYWIGLRIDRHYERPKATFSAYIAFMFLALFTVATVKNVLNLMFAIYDLPYGI